MLSLYSNSIIVIVVINLIPTTTIMMLIQVRHKLEETYSCKAGHECVITKELRNRCQFCRLQKCLQSGMNREAVQEGEEKHLLMGVGGRIKQEQGVGGGSNADEEIADQECEDQEDQDYMEAVLLSLEQVRSQMEAIDDSRRYVCGGEIQLSTIFGKIFNEEYGRRTTEWPMAVKDLHRGALTEWAR